MCTFTVFDLVLFVIICFIHHYLLYTINCTITETEIFTMFKQQMLEELEDLRDSMREMELQGWDLEEARLSENYLKNLVSLIEKRQSKYKRYWFW